MMIKMTKTECCGKEACVAYRLMLKEDWTGIINCSNPACNEHFGHVEVDYRHKK